MSGSNNSPVIVVGAGLAGLAAALNLARSGLDVMVVEASDAVGGCCSTDRISGYTFNNGAVYVAVPSALRTAFRRLGLDFDVEVELAPIAHPHRTILDDGTTIHLSSVDSSFVEGVDARERTGRLRDELAAFQRRWGPVYRTLVRDVLPAEPSLPRVLGRMWKYLPRMAGSVERLISAHFRDPAVQTAVASTLLYTGTAPARLPASQIVGFMALLEEGFHLPRGGMGAIPAALHRAAEAHGVTVRCGEKVDRIVVSDGRVTGVELAGGELIEAHYVVASCSGFEVATHLLPDAVAPARLKRRAGRSPLSHRAVSIQIGCHGMTDPGAFVVNHVPPMASQGRMHEAAPGVPRWLAYTNPVRTLPELAPDGHAVIELYAPVGGIASASEWTDAMTRETVAEHIEALERKLPGLAVDTMRVIDPTGFARQRHLYEGALYGIAPGANPLQFFPHRTRIDGLYLAGQTTFPGYGVPSAILSGLQASDALLSEARST